MENNKMKKLTMEQQLKLARLELACLGEHEEKIGIALDNLGLLNLDYAWEVSLNNRVDLKILIDCLTEEEYTQYEKTANELEGSCVRWDDKKDCMLITFYPQDF